MKYIVALVAYEDDTTLEVPLIFPNALTHAEVFKTNRPLLFFTYPGAKKITPISAGFLNLEGASFKCVGKSESLKLKARPEDTTLIRMNDYSHGLK